MKLRYMMMAALISLVAGAQAALICELDATVPGSVTTNASGVAIDWLDQSGSGNDAGTEPRIGNPTFPSTSLSASGLAGIDFKSDRNGYRLFTSAEQDSWLDFSGAASGNSGFAVFVAVKVDAVTVGARDTVFANHGNAGTTPGSFILKYETGKPTVAIGGTTYAKSGTLVASGNTLIMAFNYNAATGAFELWDNVTGTSLSNNVAAANFSSTQPLYLGTSENGGQYIDGSIGEVLVYDEFLDATTFSNKYTELTDKWAVAAAILPPSGLEAEGSFSSVILDWVDDGTGLLDFYTLYRGTSSGTYTSTTNLTVSGFTDTDVVDGTTYFYAVTATDTNANESAFSDEVSATPVAPPAEPGVSVSFTNNMPIASGNNNLGTVTLQFTVDGTGNVTLDASATGATSVGLDTVNAWDGPVGTISSTSAYNTVFSLLLDDSGQGMKISNFLDEGGALGVGGQNAWRIDRPGVEFISAVATIPIGRLELWEVDWLFRNSVTTQMEVIGPDGSYTNTLDTFNGTYDISNELVRVENGESLVFGNAIGNGLLGEGYGLAGLRFDIIDPAPVPGITVTFANNTIPLGSGDTNNVGTLFFDFIVDGSGNVTLDATSTSSIPATVAAVDAWDGPVGFITNTSFFGNTFEMEMVDVGGYGPLGAAGGVLPGNLKLTNIGGGGLGVGGLNAWRVDRNGEESIKLTATTVPVGSIEITAVNWNNRTNGDSDLLLDAPLVSLTNDLPSLAGVWDLEAEVLLNAGQELSFTTPVTGTNAPGYSVAGFSFDIVELGALVYADWAASYSLLGGPGDDDDNDGLDNLYEFAVGGNPTNNTVAPANMPTSALVNVGGSSNVLEYVYTRLEPVPADIQYYCEVSTAGLTFPNWADAGYTVTGEADAADGFKTVTNRMPVAESEKFIKLVVEQN